VLRKGIGGIRGACFIAGSNIADLGQHKREGGTIGKNKAHIRGSRQGGDEATRGRITREGEGGGDIRGPGGDP